MEAFTFTGYHIEEVTIDNFKSAGRVSPIEENSARISIPREVLEGAAQGASVRMASFLFRNMSGLLPESLSNSDGAQNDTYVKQ
jgi:hypothetical protein